MKFLLINQFTLRLLTFCTGILFSISAFAQECIPEKPSRYPFYVHDKVGALSADQVATLEATLQQFNDSTSNQFVVVIVGDLCGLTASEYGTNLGEKWGVGQAKKDNGLVIVVKTTKEDGGRKVAIEVGRGLEPVITDGTAKLIEKNEMIPAFKAGDVYQGIVNALNVLMPLAKKEFNQADYVKQQSGGGAFIFLIVLVILFVVGFKFFNARSYAQTNHTSLWTALMLTSFMNSGRGGWSDFSGGRGGFGGGGGGGFGGFGGGGFGGGGAESGW